jgi:hypothetical protein
MVKERIRGLRALVLFFVIGVAAVACQLPTNSSNAATSSGTRAKLTVSLKFPLASRTIMPTSGATGLVAPSNYNLTLSASGQADVTQASATSTVTVPNLARATWTLSVTGTDFGGQVIAAGAGSVNLSEGDTSTSVTLNYIVSGTGTGGINVTVTWPVAETVSTATLSLTDPNGVAVPPASVSATVTPATQTAVFTMGTAPVGSYGAVLTLKDADNKTLLVRPETVIVFQNLTTTGTIGLATTDFNVPVTGVSITPTSLALVLGSWHALVATVAPAAASDQGVSWSSSNTGVATVDPKSGAVLAVAAGTATITATTEDGSYAATCLVTVEGQVFYAANGATAGTVPLDSNTYPLGQPVTVLGNTGSLVNTGSFIGWNTSADGSGTNYTSGGQITMGSANITLYARWHPTMYAVGDVGPAGGYIFYDKGSYSNGWQYLEAAPTDSSKGGTPWATSAIPAAVTSAGLGKGHGDVYTAAIMALDSGSDAARECHNQTTGGYTDWYLPTVDELQLVYTNLYLKSIGGLNSGLPTPAYWSSDYNGGCWYFNFSSGVDYNDWGQTTSSFGIRPVRAF